MQGDPMTIDERKTGNTICRVNLWGDSIFWCIPRN